MTEGHWRWDDGYRLVADYPYALDIFFAVRDVIVLKKLTDDWERVSYNDASTSRSMGPYCDGAELKAKLAPHQSGYAYYWLERVRLPLEVLKIAGLIRWRKRRDGPQGYGCDEHFFLTDNAIDLCSKYKDRHDLRAFLASLIDRHVAGHETRLSRMNDFA